MSAGPRKMRSTPSMAAIASTSASASVVSIWMATKVSLLACAVNCGAGTVANRAS
jgi:hypothetical protein